MGREFQIRKVEHLKRGWVNRYPLHMMEVGDWFKILTVDIKGLRGSVYAHTQRYTDRRFTVVDMRNGYARCERVENDLEVKRGTFRINVSDYIRIDDPRIRERCIYPFELMRSGQSFTVPQSMRNKVQQAAYAFNKASNTMARIAIREGIGHDVDLGYIRVICYAKGSPPRAQVELYRSRRYAAL
jgi:hypothetical protein